MLVWLASYPRSGNHLLRIILRRSFDLGSYGVYQTEASQTRQEEAAIIGERRFTDADADQFTTRARRESELFLVKSHDSVPDSDKCIYIVRDGRAAIASYERYLSEVAQQPAQIPDIVAGRVQFGAWQDHVSKFLARDPKNTLVLRYEELASDTPRSPGSPSFSANRSCVRSTFPSRGCTR